MYYLIYSEKMYDGEGNPQILEFVSLKVMSKFVTTHYNNIHINYIISGEKIPFKFELCFTSTEKDG